MPRLVRNRSDATRVRTPVTASARAARSRLISSTTLRLTVLYCAVFGLSVILLLGFLYWATAGLMARQADATIEAEIEGLAEQYRREGLERLTRVIADRIRRDPDGKSVYLFADPQYRALAGNLDRWPEVRHAADGWVEFDFSAGNDARVTRARTFQLDGGLRLLVGRDIQELRDVRHLVVTASAWSLALTLALAVLGGLLTSRGILRRLGQINATSREIMAGDLSRRVPVGPRHDDFDELAGNLNRMLDEIERLMASVRQVSDNVAHDLRTPLTRLRNRLEAVRGEVGVGTQAHALVDSAVEDTDQLLSAFGALLRIARLESGQIELVSDEVDVAGLSADLFELYEAAADDRGIRLRQRSVPDTVVRGDRDLLFQALANLLDNALKFTPHGGEVLIESRTRPGVVELSIVDDGPGIPGELHGRVTERFFRTDASRATPGHGLGLALVAAVARHHGARLMLFDNAPGLSVVLEFDRYSNGAKALSETGLAGVGP
ncbi:MAG: ATP-binding protein [Pseudomonadota bacterium]